VHTVVAGHNGTMQKMDRNKMITEDKVQLVNHQRVTPHSTIPYPDQGQFVHLINTCLQP